MSKSADRIDGHGPAASGVASRAGKPLGGFKKIPELARRCAQCTAQIAPPSEEVAAAMRSVAAPSGEHVADEAARVLVQRLQGGNGSAYGSGPDR